MKRSGAELSATHLKENWIPSPNRWRDDSKNLSPSIQEHQFSESWNLNRKGGRDTIHFNADQSNIENLFRTIHSANQLSIYGAVSSWCEEFAQRTPNQKESTSEKFVAKANEQVLKTCEAARSE